MMICMYTYALGETEEEYATRLANNLESLILKEGPETVLEMPHIFSYLDSQNLQENLFCW